MPWSGGVFNRSNGATGWQDDEAANIGIEAVRHDTLDNDLRDGINATLTKNGTNSPSANLPMAGYRHTGAGNAVGDQDYLTFGQAKAGVNIAVAGTVDYTISQYPGATTTSANLAFQKSRGGAVGTNTIVANGDSLGSITFRGANGTTFTDSAKIEVLVDAAPGATNDMPGRLVFSTSADGSGTPTERMRIDSTGKVGIGISNPQYNFETLAESGTAVAMQVRGRSSDNIGVLRFAQNDGTTEIARIQANAGTGDLSIQRSGTNNISFATNSAERFRVGSNGNIFFSSSIATSASAANVFVDTADNYNVKRSTSSIRYKTNVENYTKGLSELNQLRPVSFNGISDGTKQFAGFIAEEVDAIGLTEFVQYDIENQPDALAYANMTALIVKAVQELLQRVEVLEGA